MKCENVLELLALYDDDVLTDEERAKVDAHVEHCEECRAALDDFRDIAMMLADLPPVEPPVELKERVYKKLQEELNTVTIEIPHVKHRKNHRLPFWFGGMVASVVLLIAFANAQGYLTPFFASDKTSKLMAATVTADAPDMQIATAAAPVRQDKKTELSSGKAKESDNTTEEPKIADSQLYAVSTSADRGQERQVGIQSSNQTSRNGISKAEHNALDDERQMLMSATAAPVAVSDIAQNSQTQALKKSMALTDTAGTAAALMMAGGTAPGVDILLATRVVGGNRYVSLTEADTAFGLNCDIQEGRLSQVIILPGSGEKRALEGVWQSGVFMVKPGDLAEMLNYSVSFNDTQAIFHK